MLKDVFSNRLFIGALAFFVLCVGGSLLYMQHVSKQSARELAETRERLKPFTSKQPTTAEAPVGDTSQGGHVHADGTWHEGAHETEVQSTTPALRETVPVDASRAPMPAATGAGNPHPFQNVPVDLYDFEATKASMIENINFVKANWDPKVYNREVSIAAAISENIANATNLPIYTTEEAEELRALHLQLLEFKGIESGRVSQLKREGHTNEEAIRIAAEETLRRWGVK